LRDRHAGLRGLGIGFGFRELGAGAIERHLEVRRIDLDEHGAGFDQLVVVHQDLRHRAADARADVGDAAIDLGVVGALARTRADVDHRAGDGDERDDRDDPPQRRRAPMAALCRFVRTFVRHYCDLPKIAVISSTGSPIARPSATRASPCR
jgi:hypothetical protein